MEETFTERNLASMTLEQLYEEQLMHEMPLVEITDEIARLEALSYPDANSTIDRDRLG